VVRFGPSISLSTLLSLSLPGDRGRYFAAMMDVLETFCDESSDGSQKEILAVSAFLAHRESWSTLEAKWLRRLHTDGVKYFSAKDCRSVQKPFRHFTQECGSLGAAKQRAQQVRADLEEILIPAPSLPPAQWHGFAVGVVIPEYRAVLRDYPIARKFWAEDPTITAYAQVMFQIVNTVRRKAKRFGVAFIVDESSDFTKIKHAFDATRELHPSFKETAKTCAGLDDKETPALQMADMLADVTRQGFVRNLHSPEIGKWGRNVSNLYVYSAKYMLKQLVKTLEHPRFKQGTLVRQLPPSKRAIRKLKQDLLDDLREREKHDGLA
jgi:hypothetical protein